MTIQRSLFSLIFALLVAIPQLASADAFEGAAHVDAVFDREHADVTITGQAAYGIFWVTAYRMRLEDLTPDVRRARGREVTCYAYGPMTVVAEEWDYACYLSVGEFGDIVAPPIPDDFPRP